MSQFLSLFDAYNLRVRLSIGLILMAPFIISIYLLVPNASNFPFTFMILIMCFGLCNLLMSISRFLGRRATAKCFPELMPAQQMLMPEDMTLDPITKKRYYKFFTSNLKGLSFSKEVTTATNSCKSAIGWLIAQTRDAEKFPLIKEETINYGFCKNLYGLKSLGICTSSFLTILEVGILAAKYHLQFGYVEYSDLIASAMVSFAVTIVWIFFVTKEWVIDCGYRYARTLLSACDSELLNTHRL